MRRFTVTAAMIAARSSRRGHDARALRPDAAGRVSRGATPIVGALVVLIDASGRTIAQTASRENGTYP
jgi:hypothetical protein